MEPNGPWCYGPALTSARPGSEWDPGTRATPAGACWPAGQRHLPVAAGGMRVMPRPSPYPAGARILMAGAIGEESRDGHAHAPQRQRAGADGLEVRTGLARRA